jgi:LasA protease
MCKRHPRFSPARFHHAIGICALIITIFTGCERPDPEVSIHVTPGNSTLPPTPILTPIGGQAVRPQNLASDAPPPTPLPVYFGTPSPDPPHTAYTENNDPYLVHIVGAGETLGYISQLYGSTLEELLDMNQLSVTDILFVGQEIRVPTQAALFGPSFKLIPDSELVHGPAAAGFDVRDFVTPFNGILLAYREEVEGRPLAGPEIVELVAHRFSVNPRLLLAVLEYRTHWITAGVEDVFVLGYRGATTPGLYAQLSWAANELNWGFYGRSEANVTSFSVSDGTRIAFAADINDGTAGVQNFLGADDDATYERWLYDTSPDGFFSTYNRLFGSPFAYTVEPLWPDDLRQPLLQLPWADGDTWYYTGGPHGGWATGSAWAALDFAPASEQLGCVESDAWVTAMADGIVTRSDFGAVVVDLDEDRYAGTGWAITYMHLETRDRIPAGTPVQTGDRLGHPSCEGGFSNGTHVHIARTYNGRWIAADGPLPFEMGGWVSQGLGIEYDGLLIRGNVTKEACSCREEGNEITADEP